jgi:hypothetical protein
MKKGLLWAVLAVLVVLVVLFALANNDQIEEGADDVEVNVEQAADDAAAGFDASIEASVGAVEDFAGEIEADASANAEEEAPLVAEEDPSFQN